MTFHSTATRSIFASTVSALLAVFGERCCIFALSRTTGEEPAARADAGRQFASTTECSEALGSGPKERGCVGSGQQRLVETGAPIASPSESCKGGCDPLCRVERRVAASAVGVRRW